MFLEVSLVRRGIITAEQFVQAVEWQLDQRPRLGRLALESGKLTMKQVFAVLEEQTDNDKPFGETAVELGFLTKRQVNNLLKQQNTKNTASVPVPDRDRGDRPGDTGAGQPPIASRTDAGMPATVRRRDSTVAPASAIAGVRRRRGRTRHVLNRIQIRGIA